MCALTHLFTCVCGGGWVMGWVYGCQRDVIPTLPQYHYLREMPCQGKATTLAGSRLNLEVGPALPLCLSDVVGGSGTLESDWV